jgi:hypothetical protein
MATALVLFALLAHQRASMWAPALFALALFTKESAIVLLALVVAQDALLNDAPFREALRRRRALYATYAVIVVAFAAILGAVFAHEPMSIVARSYLGVGPGERLMTVAAVVPEYLRLLIAPFALSADNEPGVLGPVMQLTASVLAGLALVLAYAVLTARAVRRDRPVAFALLWIPIALAPVANVVFVSGVTLAERTLYLPSVGLALLAAWAFERVGARSHRVAMIGAASVLLAFAGRSWTRTPVWHDDRRWLLTLLEDHPESYRAHLVAGRVQRAAGRLDDAEREYALSRRLFARDPLPYREAASLALERGHADVARVLLDSAALVARAPERVPVNGLGGAR